MHLHSQKERRSIRRIRFTLPKRDRDGEASMALLAGAMCGVRNNSCSRKHKYARTSHGIASESLSRGVDIFFCTGILFLETGTRASKRLKTGKNRRAFDDGSGLAARWWRFEPLPPPQVLWGHSREKRPPATNHITGNTKVHNQNNADMALIQWKSSQNTLPHGRNTVSVRVPLILSPQ